MKLKMNSYYVIDLTLPNLESALHNRLVFLNDGILENPVHLVCIHYIKKVNQRCST